jgi:hypothetical protein
MPSTRDAVLGRRLPAKDAAAAIRVRSVPLLIDKLRKARAGGAAFKPSRLIVEPLQCRELFVGAEPGPLPPRLSAPGSSDHRP